MYWQKRFNRTDPDLFFKEQIQAIRDKHPNYGYRRVCAQLKREGIDINKKKVQRIIKEMGLQVANFTRKSRYKSYRGKVGKVAPHRVNRRFQTPIVHQKITTDTSEFKVTVKSEAGRTETRKLYLNPYLDMYNGEIISYSISERPNLESIILPLEEAIKRTADCPYRRTFHSDQGWGYQHVEYINRLRKERIFQSMSRKGNCLDNSPMENFFGILKQEIYYGQSYNSFDSLKHAIVTFIDYYNKVRIKEKLGYLSPYEYRLKYSA